MGSTIMENQDTLARTCWGEARGEGSEGMEAVASVIMNRVAKAGIHPHFGDGTVAGACLAHMQFDCWNPGDPNLTKLQDVTSADPAFFSALQIAQEALQGDLEDATGGATYYYAQGTPVPPWAVGKTPCAHIGHHLFFRDIS